MKLVRLITVSCVLLTLLSCQQKPSSKSVPVVDEVIAEAVDDASAGFIKHCSQCHGQEGEGNIAFKSPAIAGMPAWYTTGEVKKFKSGLRGGHTEDTNGRLMVEAVKQVDDKTIASILSYVESMKAKRREPVLSTDYEQELYMDYCAACHRFNGSGEKAFGSPPLRYQNEWYIKEQISKYSNRLRGYDKNDLNGNKMRDVIANLPDSIDLQKIINFIQSLE